MNLGAINLYIYIYIYIYICIYIYEYGTVMEWLIGKQTCLKSISVGCLNLADTAAFALRPVA